MNIDRRKEMRIPMLLPVECSGLGVDMQEPVGHEASTYDMSPHGMSLRSRAPLDIGKPCRLVFPLAYHQAETEVAGEVRWHADQTDKGRTGIEFSRPIDLCIPFAAADKAVRGLQQHMESHSALLYQTLSDACVWVNSSGEIAQCDERFLRLLGYSEEEVRGRSICDFAPADDRQKLLDLVAGRETVGVSSPATGLFRIQLDNGNELFWKIRVLPKQAWSSFKEICIKDVTEACVLRDKKRQLEQVVGTLKRTVPGQVILLNKDLCIAEACGIKHSAPKDSPGVSFNGMDLRKVTGLARARVNGRKLWDELRLCAQTGQEFSSDLCHYKGRPGKAPDLFPPGIFRTKVIPIADVNDRVASLLMVVQSEDPFDMLGIYGGKEAESRDRLQHILGAAAIGFLLRDVLKETCGPFTSLLAWLDLLRYKLALDWKKSDVGNDNKLFRYAGEFEEVERLVLDLSDKFRHMLESTCWPDRTEIGRLEINDCLAKAISIANMYEGFDGNRIRFKPGSQLPVTGVNEQELLMILLIFLLLSRDCLKNVSDTTIDCQTRIEDQHVTAMISHNGSIRQDKHLDIIFHKKPLEAYFLKGDFTCSMDTLLYYGNCLLKKNNVRTRITNIPGYFNLSLLIPASINE